MLFTLDMVMIGVCMKALGVGISTVHLRLIENQTIKYRFTVSLHEPFTIFSIDLDYTSICNARPGNK